MLSGSELNAILRAELEARADIESARQYAEALFVLTCGVLFFALLGVFGHCLRRRPRVFAPLLQPSEKLESIQDVWQFVQQKRAKQEGLRPDGAVMVRFFEMGYRLSAHGTAFGALLLVSYWALGDESVGGLKTGTVAALWFNSSFVELPVIAAYVSAAFFIHASTLEWRHFVAVRQEHFKRAACGDYGPEAVQVLRSVMVEGVPHEAGRASAVSEFFAGIFGARGVHSCVMQGKTRHLHMPSEGPAWQARSGAAGVELVADVARGASGFNHGGGPMGNLSPTPGSKGQELMDQEDHSLPLPPASSTAFVTLRSVADRVIATQQPLTFGDTWQVREAPNCGDIVWENAEASADFIRGRSALSSVACAGCLVASAGLLAGAGWMTQPGQPAVPAAHKDSAARAAEEAANDADAGALQRSLLSLGMPVLVVFATLSVLPSLFWWLSYSFERQKLLPDIVRNVMRRYTLNLFALAYFCVITGAAWRSSTASGVSMLALELVDAMAVVTNLVVARACIILPLRLLFPLMSLKFWSQSSAQYVPVPGRCNFSQDLAEAAFVLAMGSTLSVFFPCLWLACLFYFGLGCFVYRWLFCAAYGKEFEAAGTLWLDAFQGLILGLCAGSLVLVALCGAYSGFDSAAFISAVPLPLLIAGFAIYCQSQFGSQARGISLQDAVVLDKTCASSMIDGLVSELYIDPALKTSSRASSKSSFQPLQAEVDRQDVEADGQGSSKKPSVARPSPGSRRNSLLEVDMEPRDLHGAPGFSDFSYSGSFGHNFDEDLYGGPVISPMVAQDCLKMDRGSVELAVVNCLPALNTKRQYFTLAEMAAPLNSSQQGAPASAASGYEGHSSYAQYEGGGYAHYQGSGEA